MKKILLILSFAISLIANDIIIKESGCSVDKTINNLKHIIRNKGLTIFAMINHHSNAKMVDMKLNHSKTLIFGNTRLGTALMQQDLTLGLDLPLKILVYRDSDSKVKIAYRDGSWLANKHVLDAPKKIQKINKVLDNITTKAGKCKD